MPLLQQVDRGGEYLLPFAKKKLRWFHQWMLDTGTSVVHRMVEVSDGARIYLDSLHQGGSTFRDRIRIVTGKPGRIVHVAAGSLRRISSKNVTTSTALISSTTDGLWSKNYATVVNYEPGVYATREGVTSANIVPVGYILNSILPATALSGWRSGTISPDGKIIAVFVTLASGLIGETIIVQARWTDAVGSTSGYWIITNIALPQAIVSQLKVGGSETRFPEVSTGGAAQEQTRYLEVLFPVTSFYGETVYFYSWVAGSTQADPYTGDVLVSFSSRSVDSHTLGYNAGYDRMHVFNGTAYTWSYVFTLATGEWALRNIDMRQTYHENVEYVCPRAIALSFLSSSDPVSGFYDPAISQTLILGHVSVGGAVMYRRPFAWVFNGIVALELLDEPAQGTVVSTDRGLYFAPDAVKTFDAESTTSWVYPGNSEQTLVASAIDTVGTAVALTGRPPTGTPTGYRLLVGGVEYQTSSLSLAWENVVVANGTVWVATPVENDDQPSSVTVWNLLPPFSFSAGVAYNDKFILSSSGRHLWRSHYDIGLDESFWSYYKDGVLVWDGFAPLGNLVQLNAMYGVSVSDQGEFFASVTTNAAQSGLFTLAVVAGVPVLTQVLTMDAVFTIPGAGAVGLDKVLFDAYFPKSERV